MIDLSNTVVDERYSQFQELRSFLEEAGESSHLLLVRDAFQRNLTVAAASLFEQLVKDAIREFSHQRSGGDAAIVRLIEVGITDRGYHAMFDWKENKANKFFTHFGRSIGSLGSNMREECARNKELESAEKAFLQLGRLRNNLVHNNFAFVPMDQTVEEIYDLFTSAKVFVQFIIFKLEERR